MLAVCDCLFGLKMPEINLDDSLSKAAPSKSVSPTNYRWPLLSLTKSDGRDVKRFIN